MSKYHQFQVRVSDDDRDWSEIETYAIYDAVFWDALEIILGAHKDWHQVRVQPAGAEKAYILNREGFRGEMEKVSK